MALRREFTAPRVSRLPTIIPMVPRPPGIRVLPPLLVCLGSLLPGGSAPAFAQATESVGVRALGMAGAFVAVADDSSAVWWNPGALAAGPFVDATLSRSVTDSGGGGAAGRTRDTFLALTIPVFGISYAKVRATDAVQAPGGGAAARSAVRSLDMGQFGVTLVQTLTTGVHVDTTLKVMSGVVRSGTAEGVVGETALDAGDALDGGGGVRRFDLDVGVLAVAGGVRLGVLVRHLAAPAFGRAGAMVRLPRQTRLGFAFNAAEAGGPPLVLSVDLDANAVAAAEGDRRIVALGAEQRLLGGRVGVRGGLRFNTAGRQERVVAAGASVAVRDGFMAEGFAARGGSDLDRAWGLGGRVSF